MIARETAMTTSPYNSVVRYVSGIRANWRAPKLLPTSVSIAVCKPALGSSAICSIRNATPYAANPSVDPFRAMKKLMTNIPQRHGHHVETRRYSLRRNFPKERALRQVITKSHPRTGPDTPGPEQHVPETHTLNDDRRKGNSGSPHRRDSQGCKPEEEQRIKPYVQDHADEQDVAVALRVPTRGQAGVDDRVEQEKAGPQEDHSQITHSQCQDKIVGAHKPVCALGDQKSAKMKNS